MAPTRTAWHVLLKALLDERAPSGSGRRQGDEHGVRTFKREKLRSGLKREDFLSVSVLALPDEMSRALSEATRETIFRGPGRRAGPGELPGVAQFD